VLGNILCTPAVWPYVLCQAAADRLAAAVICSGDTDRLTDTSRLKQNYSE